jgi:RNA polymerase sigma-70 factor (ECF subfamily)
MGADDELMERWQRGDESAFTALVRRWEQPIARFLFRSTGRTELTRDLCQEVFLRVLGARDRYRPGAFAAWIYRIALNVARDAGRRRQNTAHPLAEIELYDPQASVETVCAGRELRERVASAVAELPEPLRVVLILHHDQGLTFDAISKITATPVSTLKSRFAAALVRLRDRLTQLGCAPEETEA